MGHFELAGIATCLGGKEGERSNEAYYGMLQVYSERVNRVIIRDLQCIRWVWCVALLPMLGPIVDCRQWACTIPGLKEVNSIGTHWN